MTGARFQITMPAMTPLSRRRFLTLTGLGLLASRTGLAIGPFQRAGSARWQLSLAAYSFRDFFKVQQGKDNPAGRIGMPVTIRNTL